MKDEEDGGMDTLCRKEFSLYRSSRSPDAHANQPHMLTRRSVNLSAENFTLLYPTSSYRQDRSGTRHSHMIPVKPVKPVIA